MMEDMSLFGTSNNESDLEMVKRDGSKLASVKNQTTEICLAAVKDYGLALEFVKKQTPAICLTAAKQNWKAFRFVKQEILDEFENLIRTKEG